MNDNDLTVNEKDLTVCKWGTKVLTFDKRSESYKTALLQAARTLSDLFKTEFGIDLFVSYGVLLGFTRGDGFIGMMKTSISPTSERIPLFRNRPAGAGGRSSAAIYAAEDFACSPLGTQDLGRMRYCPPVGRTMPSSMHN